MRSGVAALVAVVVVSGGCAGASFSGDEWRAEFDWCLTHRVGQYVDCRAVVDLVEENVVEYGYEKECTVRAVRSFVAQHYDAEIVNRELRRCRSAGS